MLKQLGAIVLSLTLALVPTSLGTYKVTEYCKACSGTTTSLGEPVREGIVATNPSDIPYGTIVIVEGKEYEVADYCGNAVNVEPTIDIYREWGDETCHCSRSEYVEVFKKK